MSEPIYKTRDGNRNASILVVDDTPENLRLLIECLDGESYSVRLAPSGERALRAVEKQHPDLILLDINMPGMDGFEVCRRLKADDATKDIPIVFISALSEMMDKVKAFAVGGVDYVTKPFQLEEVVKRVETHLALRAMQRELQAKFDELTQLEELRDSLVHMIVHDMRSPLTGLVASLGFLKQDLAESLSGESVADMDLAIGAAARLNAMANDVLDVSHLDATTLPLERADHDVVEIVRIAVESVAAISLGHPIAVDGAQSLVAYCDDTVLRRVMENLIGNGLKYTPSSLPLRIVISAPVGGGARIEVIDQGAGLPPEWHERIFEKYGALRARKARAYHSAGLGLAFCKMAMEAHGGTVGVQSELGKGSIFFITLPPKPAGRPSQPGREL